MPRDFAAEHEYRYTPETERNSSMTKFPMKNDDDVTSFIQRKLDTIPEISNGDKFVARSCNWVEIKDFIKRWRKERITECLVGPKEQALTKIMLALEEQKKI